MDHCNSTVPSEPNLSMKSEIETAINFLSSLMKSQISEVDGKRFTEVLKRMLYAHYADHWHTSQPERGSGYRCLRINGKMDPLLIKAAKAAGLYNRQFRCAFPASLTVWVDPGDVSYRIGEEGSVCSLFQAGAHPSEVVPLLLPTAIAAPPSQESQSNRSSPSKMSSQHPPRYYHSNSNSPPPASYAASQQQQQQDQQYSAGFMRASSNGAMPSRASASFAYVSTPDYQQLRTTSPPIGSYQQQFHNVQQPQMFGGFGFSLPSAAKAGNHAAGYAFVNGVVNQHPAASMYHHSDPFAVAHSAHMISHMAQA